MSELLVKPTDSDRLAQLKIGIMCVFLAAMVLGPVAEYLPDINSERAYRLVALAGLTIGMYLDRKWWTS